MNRLIAHQKLKKKLEAIGVESNSVDWTGNRVSLLQTISNVSVELPAEPAADLAHNLHKRIEEFNMHSMEIFRVLYCKEMEIPTNKGSSLESSEMEEESAENAVK
nr:condensin-2 complex subunit D3 [Tanacetum cinerariifolium]